MDESRKRKNGTKLSSALPSPRQIFFPNLRPGWILREELEVILHALPRRGRARGRERCCSEDSLVKFSNEARKAHASGLAWGDEASVFATISLDKQWCAHPSALPPPSSWRCFPALRSGAMHVACAECMLVGGALRGRVGCVCGGHAGVPEVWGRDG